MAILTTQPPVIVFYSFKGGVGRSMALINCACILAGRGRRVLAVDLDLEAPGISYLLHRERSDKGPAKGFIDLIHDFLVERSHSALANRENPLAFMEYTHEFPIPETIRTAEGGSLRIMPAGMIDGEYERRRQAIDLHQLYRQQKGQPLMKHLRSLLIESGQFDYIFVDSRTGFSDEAGISIRDLGDHVMVLLGLNRQNVEGSARFVERMKASVKDKKLMVEFVASPIPLGEDELYEERISEARRCLSDAWGSPVRLNLQIPYHPRLALDEQPSIFRRSQGALYEAYAALETRIREITGDTVQEWSRKAQMAVDGEDHDAAVRAFRELTKLNKVHASDQLRYTLRHFGETETFERYWQLFRELFGQDAEYFKVGIRHYGALKDQKQVRSLFKEALTHCPEDLELLDSAASYYARKDVQKAEELFRLALDKGLRDANSIANFTSLLISKKRWEPAEEMVMRAWGLADRQPNQPAAEIAFYRGVLLRIKNENDDKPLGVLKTMLQVGYPRGSWSFTPVLKAVQKKLTVDDFALYTAVSTAILQVDLEPLEDFSRWKSVEALPLGGDI